MAGLGKYCQSLNITEESLKENTLRFHMSNLTKGLAIELFLFAKSQFEKPVDKCTEWFANLFNLNPETISKETLKSKLYQLVAKKKTLGGKGAKLFMDEPFFIPMATAVKEEVGEKSLPKAVSNKTEEKKAKETIANMKYENMLVKRKLKRAQDKIDHLKESKKAITKQKDSHIKEIEKSLQSKTTLFQSDVLEPEKKRRKLEQEIRELKQSVKEKNEVIEGLSSIKDEMETVIVEATPVLHETKEETQNALEQIKDLTSENEYLKLLLEDNAPLNIYDDTTNSYSSELSHCVMDLLNCNVPARNVSQAISVVSRLCGRVPNKLPSRQTVDRINDQKIFVTSEQMKVISEHENLTLYSDETSKFGRSFEVFAVTDSDRNSYLLGLREMHSKSSETVLDTLKQILSDIDAVSDGTYTGQKILSNIKNTMSDRAATEKKFQQLLEDYRKEILPKIKEGWDIMNDEERKACGSMNNFFCGLHILVNFADVCAEALLKYENSILGDDNPTQADDNEEEQQKIKQNESGTLRLIRTASKAFARGVDEKSGVYGPFKTYMENKKQRVQFVKFKHNRFNILFLMGQITYLHRKDIEDFIENIHGPTNKLLMSVLKDIKTPILKAGCRALGIISHYITSPLWRIIEDNSHILEMTDVYSNLLEFFTKAKNDSTEVITGSFLPFPEVNIVDTNLLTEDAETDTITVQILQWLFEAMAYLLERQAKDHLPGGKFYSSPATTWEESQGTIKHNKLPEFFFGQLDFLLRFKPNATTLCNEAFLIFSHNKTNNWLANLSDIERDTLLKEAKKEGPKIRQRFQERMKEIEAKRLTALKKKEKELHEKKERLYKRKEKMTNDILFFGLWQSSEDMIQQLAEIDRKTEKMKAVKAQLTFRKKVLQQHTKDKSSFAFSAGSKAKTLEQLMANLKLLINEARKGSSTEKISKKKPLLVNKHIKHKFDDAWYYGQILSVVPGFTDWYNVKYDGDDAIYVYKLQEDYEQGDLLIVPQKTGRC